MFTQLFADGGLIAVIVLSAAVGAYWLVKEKPDLRVLAPYVLMAVYLLTPYTKTVYTIMGIAILMCVARVVALVHTPFDIVGGIGAGLFGTLWYVKHKHDIFIHS
jgi:uncharacterized membrane protein YccC